jgi:hypothetical protein
MRDSDPLELLLARLERVRRSGEGWQASCPCDGHAHDDRSPSLSVSRGRDRAVLARCRAFPHEHTLEAICAAAGLSPEHTTAVLAARTSESAPASAREQRNGRPLPGEDRLAAYAAALQADAAALRRAWTQRRWTPATLAALGIGWDGGRYVMAWRDHAGHVTGVGRYLPGGEPKMRAAAGSRRGLFPPPERVPGEPVWLVEGEADVLAATAAGLPAVGVPGVGGWRDSYAQRFAGRRVVVALDCDRAGRHAAQRIAAALHPHIAEVRVLDLEPAREDGHDLTDWLMTVERVEELPQARALLERAGELAPEWRPEPEPAPGGWLRSAADLLGEDDTSEPPWLIEELLADAAIGAILGAPKAGKTWLLLELAVAVVTSRRAAASPCAIPAR